MNPQKILSFVIDVGEIMLKNGAETTRVEDTMLRLLGIYSFKSNDVFVTPTVIIGSITDESTNVITIVRRISNLTMNLEKISLCNSLSRNLVAKTITIDEAILDLQQINEKPSYKNIYKYFSSGLSSGCFAFIFGGSLMDSLNAFLTGFFLYILIVLCDKKNVSNPITNILCGAFTSFFVLSLMRLGLGDNMDMAIIGSIMPLVPGVSFTIAVRDIISGEYISGIIRSVAAILVAICIATGVGIGLSIWFGLSGELSLWF